MIEQGFWSHLFFWLKLFVWGVVGSAGGSQASNCLEDAILDYATSERYPTYVSAGGIGSLWSPLIQRVLHSL
eukprot:1414449-Amphidinium_carterae.1